MIKRKVRIFTRDNLFQDFLDTMEEDTTIAHYSVNDNGTHYIITERKMSDEEAKQFKLKQLKKQIDECNAHWEERIKYLEKSANMYNNSLNFKVANMYMQRREEAIEAYNEEQNKLANKLDKLQKSL